MEFRAKIASFEEALHKNIALGVYVFAEGVDEYFPMQYLLK